MDQRGREANKRHRSKNSDINYKTVSLTMAEPVIKELEKAVNNTDDKNSSKYIEENVTSENITKNEEKRKYEGNKIKKTFTFAPHPNQQVVW